MKILIYPLRDYICAECGYHMLVLKDPTLVGGPVKKVTVQCVNDNCKNRGKCVVIKPEEIEVEDE